MVLHPTRRDVLKLLGATGATGGIATASALDPGRDGDQFRLFSEQAVDDAMEVVTH